MPANKKPVESLSSSMNNLPFEVAMKELESLVARMESGEQDLEQSLQSYERGALLIKNCQQSLSRIESQVKVLEAGLLKSFEENRSEE